MKMKKLLTLILMIVIVVSFSAAEPARFFVVEADTNIERGRFDFWFTEPCEILYIVMLNKKIFRFTTYNEDEIVIEYWELEKEIKRNGYEISDISFMIHNHPPGNPYFTPKDKDTFRRLLHCGFAGKFLLYGVRAKWIKALIITAEKDSKKFEKTVDFDKKISDNK